MSGLAQLGEALLAAVPVDGSSIGNQTLFERLKAQLPETSEEQLWAARDALIEQGVLVKGRGRGGSVLRAQASGSSLADQVLNKARERMAPVNTEEVSAGYVVQAAEAVKKTKAPKQQATSIEAMEKTLWATADKLRANMDAAEYKHIVLGLIFLKYISDSFAGRRAELERKLLDENDDYYLGDDDPELLAAELEDRDYYREVNVFWVPEVARWESIRAAAKQVDIGKRIDDAAPRLMRTLLSRMRAVGLRDGAATADAGCRCSMGEPMRRRLPSGSRPGHRDPRSSRHSARTIRVDQRCPLPRGASRRPPYRPTLLERSGSGRWPAHWT